MEYMIMWRDTLFMWRDTLFDWHEVEWDFLDMEEAQNCLKSLRVQHPDRIYCLFIKMR